MRLSPPRPAIRNLRPTDGIASINRDAGAALRQRLRRHQPGGTGADDGDFDFESALTPRPHPEDAAAVSKDAAWASWFETREARSSP